jgi:hypothetical protein
MDGLGNKFNSKRFLMVERKKPVWLVWPVIDVFGDCNRISESNNFTILFSSFTSEMTRDGGVGDVTRINVIVSVSVHRFL